MMRMVVRGRAGKVMCIAVRKGQAKNGRSGLGVVLVHDMRYQKHDIDIMPRSQCAGAVASGIEHDFYHARNQHPHLHK